MAPARLRLFPYSDDVPSPTAQVATVTIRLAEFYPLLARAARANLGWLDDFADDEIRVTPDFYDVIRAYAQLRPTA